MNVILNRMRVLLQFLYSLTVLDLKKKKKKKGFGEYCRINKPKSYLDHFVFIVNKPKSYLDHFVFIVNKPKSYLDHFVFIVSGHQV
jgi:hypothetical protein